MRRNGEFLEVQEMATWKFVVPHLVNESQRLWLDATVEITATNAAVKQHHAQAIHVAELPEDATFDELGSTVLQVALSLFPGQSISHRVMVRLKRASNPEVNHLCQSFFREKQVLKR